MDNSISMAALAVLITLGIVVSVVVIGTFVLLYVTRKVWLSAIILWFAKAEICFDQVKEGYVAHYESGGKFMALACSYGEFGPVKAPGDLNWAIRRVGERDIWKKAWEEDDGTEHPEEWHTYSQEDFQWDRRLEFVKNLFGNETGIVWMGWWPTVKARYYNLRISNFRTVKPDDNEVKSKDAQVKVYTAGGNTDEKNAAGYLVSWNEWSKQSILSDDNYPIPVDGVRIGIGSDMGEKKKQGVVGNILVIIRGRIREPYLFFYRAEDTLETIQNEMIQHIRQLCASKTIEELYSLKTTLESDKTSQVNPILSMNNFGSYIRERYGFSIKSASFAYITILGDAGIALSAPFVAQQNADAAKIRGTGEGDEEYERLSRAGKALAELAERVGPEVALAMRSADVAQEFAESKNSSTVVLGFDSKTILGSSAGAVMARVLPTKPKKEESEEKQ